jgi:hypothetical protein
VTRPILDSLKIFVIIHDNLRQNNWQIAYENPSGLRYQFSAAVALNLRFDERTCKLSES